jgi:hypothetical protein
MKNGALKIIVKAATVEHRGKLRPCVVQLDPSTGMLHVRPQGCRKGKTYSIADLFTWGQQLHASF